MSTTTGIEWTDATWTPVTGCSKVRPGSKRGGGGSAKRDDVAPPSRRAGQAANTDYPPGLRVAPAIGSSRYAPASHKSSNGSKEDAFGINRGRWPRRSRARVSLGRSLPRQHSALKAHR